MSAIERALGHPAKQALEAVCDGRLVVCAHDRASARDVDVICQPQRHGHRRVRLLELTVEGIDRSDDAALPTGKHDHVIAATDDATGDLAGV